MDEDKQGRVPCGHPVRGKLCHVLCACGHACCDHTNDGLRACLVFAYAAGVHVCLCTSFQIGEP